MSVYGALYSGVSGLKSQSTKIAAISDNISNVNTVGYKAVQGEFRTLVTNSGGGTAYSPGGVIGGVRQLVSQQGLLQATNSATDIAISGDGFFVVNQLSDGLGQVFYTRAGSFTQDATGNFRNSAGFFLQAWPLDRQGRLPGQPGNADTISSANLSSLQTVNVQNLTGVAAATTDVALSANLKASEAIFTGASVTGGMDINDSANVLNKAADIIIPQGSGSVDSLERGDILTVSTGGGSSFNFTYGGFTLGRLVTAGTGGDYSGSDYASGAGTYTLASGSFSVGNNSTTVTVTFPSNHLLQDGDTITIGSNTGAVGTVPASDLNGTFVVDVQSATTVNITVATTNTSGGTATGGANAIADKIPFDSAGYILDASSATQSFLGSTGTSIFSTASLSFTISTSSITGGAATFTYKGSAPNVQAGQFNNMTNLAQAISAVDGLTARVSGGRLYVSAINAENDITFTNGSRAGTDGTTAGTALYGIDWVRELGLDDISGTSGQFSTMEGLADLVNFNADISATISSPLSDSEITINVDDPLDTLTIVDDSGNTGSVVAALGFVDSLDGAAFTAQTTNALGPAYDPIDGTKNMSSGSITPQFTRPIRVYDSLGSGHDLNVGFIKTGINTWAVEVYAIDETEVVTSLPNGLLTYGTITFNGDGSLQSLTSLLVNDVTIAWANQASDSTVAFNWGTSGTQGVGATDGLSQFDSNYKVNFANQNGAPVGELTGVSIDEDGFITVSYSNGETQQLFKIPLADFPNPDELQAISGNVFLQTSASGEVNLSEAGSSGVGKFAPSSLESSNVELADQLTDMIVAQRAYQANTKVISTADSMLEQLNQIIR
jgi:flagellar hook protein FlgE